MSVIHVGHIKSNILSRLDFIIDLFEVLDSSREQSKKACLTQSLASLPVADLGHVDDLTADMCFFDGTRDDGIDASYVHKGGYAAES